MAGTEDVLKLHLEPDQPIDVKHLTGALGSLSRQYQEFARQQGFSSRPADARLLVSSVSRGSIDINFIPELAAAGVMVLPLVEQGELVLKLANHIKSLLDMFSSGKSQSAALDVQISDCDDAINIVRPIAESGGTQTFCTINGDVTINVLQTSAAEARKIMEKASAKKAELQFPDAEKRQRVSMVWHQLAKDAPVVAGKRSPDQGVISEIDMKPRAVFFTDEMAYLKSEMIDEEDNPYRKVYFVDVEVSRVADKVTAYRVTGFHGKDDLTDAGEFGS